MDVYYKNSKPNKLIQMKKIIFLFVAILTANTFFAQNADINKTREIYNAANETNLQVHNLELNSMLPAIGLQTTSVKFLFDAEQANPEKDPFLMNTRLVKVEITYNISSHTEHFMEYLFNEEGYLIFHFERAKGMLENFENRYYFNDESLIKVIHKETLESGEINSYTSSSDYKKDDLKTARISVDKGGYLTRLFEKMIEIERLMK